MRNPTIRLLVLAAVGICLCCTLSSARADEPQLTLSLQRLMGYGGLAGDIEGTFRLRATGPADLTRVVILMDGAAMAEPDSSPFQVQFNTSQFAPGLHTMQARGTTASGLELTSNEIRSRFLTADQARKATASLIIPLLGAIVAFTFLSYLISAAVSRRAKASGQSIRTYGISGGAVCRRCGRPFALHWWAPHLLTSKLERCPHCGKWAFVRAASGEELRAAEGIEDAGISATLSRPPTNDEEKLRKELEESRFRDA